MKLSQLEFLWPTAKRLWLRDPGETGRGLPAILYRRNPLARRYRLFVDREGRARVTIPRRGNRIEAEAFAAKHADWLAEQLRRHDARRASVQPWQVGIPILFRGQLTPIERHPNDAGDYIRVGSEVIPVPANPDPALADLRSTIEEHWRRLASIELPQRTLELAAAHARPVRKVTVRNQRSRWGSCSRRGTISLNWRLVQVPFEVRDYIILHELMHLREMNHSRCFWALVAKACPDYKASEAWLRAHSANML